VIKTDSGCLITRECENTSNSYLFFPDSQFQGISLSGNPRNLTDSAPSRLASREDGDHKSPSCENRDYRQHLRVYRPIALRLEHIRDLLRLPRVRRNNERLPPRSRSARNRSTRSQHSTDPQTQQPTFRSTASGRRILSQTIGLS
jgi:hypothetical protein